MQQKTSQRLVVTRAKSFTGDAAWLEETENGNLKELLVPYPADRPFLEHRWYLEKQIREFTGWRSMTSQDKEELDLK